MGNTVHNGNGSSKAISLVSLIGPIGCGKSTVAEIIGSFFQLNGSGRHIFVPHDTSRIIKQAVQKQTPAGIRLTKSGSLELMKKGGLADTECVLLAITERLENDAVEIQKKTGKKPIFIVTGSPRRSEETDHWTRQHHQGATRWSSVFLEADTQKTCRGIALRLLDGLNNGDDLREEDINPNAIQERLDKFNDETLPAIRAIPENLRIAVNRSNGMAETLFATIMQLQNVGLTELEMWLLVRRLASSNQNPPLRKRLKGLLDHDKVPLQTILTSVESMGKERGRNLRPVCQEIMRIAEEKEQTEVNKHSNGSGEDNTPLEVFLERHKICADYPGCRIMKSQGREEVLQA